jgi:hypothetical protein
MKGLIYMETVMKQILNDLKIAHEKIELYSEYNQLLIDKIKELEDKIDYLEKEVEINKEWNIPI